MVYTSKQVRTIRVGIAALFAITIALPYSMAQNRVMVLECKATPKDFKLEIDNFFYDLKHEVDSIFSGQLLIVNDYSDSDLLKPSRQAAFEPFKYLIYPSFSTEEGGWVNISFKLTKVVEKNVKYPFYGSFLFQNNDELDSYLSGLKTKIIHLITDGFNGKKIYIAKVDSLFSIPTTFQDEFKNVMEENAKAISKYALVPFPKCPCNKDRSINAYKKNHNLIVFYYTKSFVQGKNCASCSNCNSCAKIGELNSSTRIELADYNKMILNLINYLDNE